VGRPTIPVSREDQVGPALREIRKAHGLTQRDVSEAMDTEMDPTHMGAYERGRVVPNTKRLLEILRTHNYVLVLTPREGVPDHGPGTRA